MILKLLTFGTLAAEELSLLELIVFEALLLLEFPNGLLLVEVLVLLLPFII